MRTRRLSGPQSRDRDPGDHKKIKKPQLKRFLGSHPAPSAATLSVTWILNQ
jgi:hypothetical protein